MWRVPPCGQLMTFKAPHIIYLQNINVVYMNILNNRWRKKTTKQGNKTKVTKKEDLPLIVVYHAVYREFSQNMWVYIYLTQTSEPVCNHVIIILVRISGTWIRRHITLFSPFIIMQILMRFKKKSQHLEWANQQTRVKHYIGVNYILYPFLWSYSKWGVHLLKQIKAFL